jgi:hypothetical protein
MDGDSGMSARRKVCVVVNSRANYGRIKTVLRALRDHHAVQLQLLVGASALLHRFGKRSSSAPPLRGRLGQMVCVTRFTNRFNDCNGHFAARLRVGQQPQYDQSTPFAKLHAFTLFGERTQWPDRYQLQCGETTVCKLRNWVVSTGDDAGRFSGAQQRAAVGNGTQRGGTCAGHGDGPATNRQTINGLT